MTPHRTLRTFWPIWASVLISLALLAGWTSGCALKTHPESVRRQAALVVAANETALTQLRVAEQAWYSAGRHTDTQHREFLEVLLKLQDTLSQTAQILLLWQPGQPVPAQVMAYLNYAEDAGGRAQQVAGVLQATVSGARAFVQTGQELIGQARALRAMFPSTR